MPKIGEHIPKKPRRLLFDLFGLRFLADPDVPENEVWAVQNGVIEGKIVDGKVRTR